MAKKKRPIADEPVNEPCGILIVSRGERLMGNLANIFASHGDHVMTAGDVVDAWECIRSGGIELVVLDLTAASLDDVYLFRTTRTTTNTYDLPFLFLVRKEYPLPQFSKFGEEIVRDTWLSVPCSGSIVWAAAQKLVHFRRQDLAQDEGAGVVDEADQKFERPEDFYEDEYVGIDLENYPEDDAWPSARSGVKKKNTRKPMPDKKVESSSSLPGMFAGSLNAIEVSKILSMIEPLGLTGILHLTDGNRTGQIYFDKGSVRHAILEEIVGPDALFLLFHLRQGDFRFEAAPAPQEVTIHASTISLLLEGLRQMDEANAAIIELKANREQRLKSGVMNSDPDLQ